MALFLILLTALLSLNYTPYAAVLEVNYAGVSVQRTSTEAWLPLQPLSIAPIGDGDSLQTNSVGRATIHFSDIASVFALSNLNATIHHFALSDDRQADISMTVDGISIYTIHQPDRIDNFQLNIGDLTIYQPAESFAIWTSNTNQISIIVNQGTLLLEENGQTIEIPAGYGYNQLRATVADINFFPTNEATLFTSIIRCEGLATAENNQNLTVRSAPSSSGQVTGYIHDQTPVYVIGISSDQRRLRVRYYSSFGWVETTGVTYQCDNLPIYDLDRQERYATIVNPSQAEYALTYPYFGSVMDDPYFYIYENAPLGE